KLEESQRILSAKSEFDLFQTGGGKEMIILYLVDNLKEGDERVLDEDEDEEVRLPLLTQYEISKISLTKVEPNVRLTCMHVQYYDGSDGYDRRTKKKITGNCSTDTSSLQLGTESMGMRYPERRRETATARTDKFPNGELFPRDEFRASELYLSARGLSPTSFFCVDNWGGLDDHGCKKFDEGGGEFATGRH
ncbi:unnamed protein product, partial [Citrullus colocynthis]